MLRLTHAKRGRTVFALPPESREDSCLGKELPRMGAYIATLKRDGPGRLCRRVRRQDHGEMVKDPDPAQVS